MSTAKNTQRKVPYPRADATIEIVRTYLLPLLCLLLGISASLGTWFVMNSQKAALQASLETQLQTQKEDTAKAQLAYTTEKATLEEKIAALASTTSDLAKDRSNLQDSLQQSEDKVTTIEKQVGSAIKTVTTLDKLSKIDTELLQKYSKVSFLNEHYIPSKLASVKNEYVYNENQKHQLHAQVMPFFEKMEEAALKDGVKLYVSSSYRSFGEQGALKSAYSVTYGSGANSFSADQGYSEHQLGTTIDFTTTGINGGLGGFDTTPAYTWMTQNAYKYGFTLSYPKGNKYYVFEPWHWRFVGTKLAKTLHSEKQYFYDMDQREISKYLISIFD